MPNDDTDLVKELRQAEGVASALEDLQKKFDVLRRKGDSE